MAIDEAKLAERTGTQPRLVAEWLAAQAASGHVSYDPTSGRFWLTEEQEFTLADEDGPMYLPGAFQVKEDSRGQKRCC